MLQELGWNSDEVTTSVSSSMFSGLMSTVVKVWDESSKFHRFTRRSSADRNVSPSEHTEMLLIWYACALAYTLRGVAATTVSVVRIRGTFKTDTLFDRDESRFPSKFVFDTSVTFFSNTRHSFTVLSSVESGGVGWG